MISRRKANYSRRLLVPSIRDNLESTPMSTPCPLSQILALQATMISWTFPHLKVNKTIMGRSINIKDESGSLWVKQCLSVLRSHRESIVERAIAQAIFNLASDEKIKGHHVEQVREATQNELNNVFTKVDAVTTCSLEGDLCQSQDRDTMPQTIFLDGILLESWEEFRKEEDKVNNKYIAILSYPT